MSAIFWFTIIALCILTMTMGCSSPMTISEPPVQVIDTACLWAKPIMISQSDKLSPGTARQILQFDLLAKKNCSNVK